MKKNWMALRKLKRDDFYWITDFPRWLVQDFWYYIGNIWTKGIKRAWKKTIVIYFNVVFSLIRNHQSWRRHVSPQTSENAIWRGLNEGGLMSFCCVFGIFCRFFWFFPRGMFTIHDDSLWGSRRVFNNRWFGRDFWSRQMGPGEKLQ